ncbi:hypothetical protein [Maricaulis sp.]|uniref:hypothetical protein n=1 Tax=Maricaulis sp. TaxID=1486257 RepID=UPI00260EEDF0|nr:hypothetical protein [Maricaulis sp.]
MNKSREKFATQIDSALLADLRNLAKAEGRQIQTLVEEAIGNLIETRKTSDRKARILALHEESMAQYDDVYRKLAE